MTRKPHQSRKGRRKAAAEDDSAEATPNRTNRPAVEALGGTSEYQVQAATDLDEDEGDPLASVIEDAPEGGEDLFEPELASTPHRGGPPLETLSIEPDELGAHFLRGAVQDPRPEDEDYDIRKDRENLTQGEGRMLNMVRGHVETEGALITELPEPSDVEAELSELTERAGREVRQPDRAKRIREQSLRVARQRRTPVRGHPR